jgi:hypothetical protein
MEKLNVEKLVADLTTSLTERGYNYVSVQHSRRLGGDAVHFWITQEKQENWPFGIFHNAEYVIGSVYFNGKNHQAVAGCTISLSFNRRGLRNANKMSDNLEKVAVYILKQLDKGFPVKKIN